METSVEETVKKIITRIVRKPDSAFKPDATFKDFDADSLDIVQILVAVEDTYDIEIEDEELEKITDMAGFISYVKRRIAENR